MDLKNIINNSGADAWIIYDFASQNPAFKSIIGDIFLTRKCFVIIKATGRDIIICHAVDSGTIKKNIDKKYDIIIYKNWNELILLLKKELQQFKNVLMEISENGLLPKVSYVDYGTVNLIKNIVREVKSSADIFQHVTAVMSNESYILHKNVAIKIDEIKNIAFEYIFKNIKNKKNISEYDVQQKILELFSINNIITDSVPIVAIGINANDPHYEPTKDSFSLIRQDDLVLIDLWGKYNDEKAVFADITWMAYIGSTPDKKYIDIFNIVKDSISSGLDFINNNLPKRKLCGYEIDDVCREYINRYGYGDYFIHRTGHSLSIGESDHGVGVNIDNYETHDERTLLDGIAFSMEPGIYLPEFGLREEINVCIQDNKVIITTPRQAELICLHKNEMKLKYF